MGEGTRDTGFMLEWMFLLKGCNKIVLFVIFSGQREEKKL